MMIMLGVLCCAKVRVGENVENSVNFVQFSKGGTLVLDYAYQVLESVVLLKRSLKL